MLKYQFRPTIKYMITICTPKIVIIFFLVYLSHDIRMSGKNVNFRDKK